MSKDYYKILGVSRDCSEAELKKAYRRLARQYHPDANTEDPEAEAKFKVVSEAYAVLSNSDKRRQYDTFGTVKGDIFAGFDPFTDLGDIFGMFFGDVQSPRGRAGGRTVARGADLGLEIEVTLEEVATGVHREVEVTRLSTCRACGGSGLEAGTHPEACFDCHGTGQVNSARQTFFGQFVTTSVCPRCRGEGQIISHPCKACGGDGRAEESENMKIEIPAGVQHGMQLRLSGKGEAGVRGAPAGDLYVPISVGPHPIFERDNEDIHCHIPITFTQAALGAEIMAPSLNGDIKLHVPAGTQTHSTFEFKGKGLPRLGGHARGRELVTVVVETPKDLTKEQKEFLGKLAESRGEEPSPSPTPLKRIRDAFSGN